MKIINSRVNWKEDYHNYPVLECLVDDIPKLDDILFHQIDNLFWGECSGYIKYFLSTTDQRGFCRANYNLNMVDGTKKTLIGPWKTSPGFPNSYCTWRDLAVECKITSSIGVWNSGFTFEVGCISMELAVIAAKIANVFLVPEHNDSGPEYYPSLHPKILVKKYKTNNVMVFNHNHDIFSLKEIL